MGRLVLMSANTKFKMTTIQKEVWFFTKIVSGLALGLFSLAIIVWGASTRVIHPGFATASAAIINSIGCLTAFVPQVIVKVSVLQRLAQVVQGLPVCVALSLTIVAKRMAKRQVLVKNLATIEASVVLGHHSTLTNRAPHADAGVHVRSLLRQDRNSHRG